MNLRIHGSPREVKETLTTPTEKKFGRFKKGDILTSQNGNKMTSVGQKVLMRGSNFAKSTHVGIVTKVTKNHITVLESINQKDRNGVHLVKYDVNKFKEEFMGKEGVNIVRCKEELKEDLIQAMEDFAHPYKKEEVVTTYGFKHLLSTSTHKASETKKGRKRTIHAFGDKQLKTSKGEARKGTICSELVAEIVKHAQIRHEHHKDTISTKELKKLQKAKKVLNISTEHVSVGRLEKELTEKFDFTQETVKRSALKDEIDWGNKENILYER